MGNCPALRIRFGSLGKFVQTGALSGRAGPLPALVLAGRLDMGTRDPKDGAKLSAAQLAASDIIAPEVEAAVGAVTIRMFGRSVNLQLGSMGSPMATLRKCTGELVKQWGLDPAEQQALGSLPQPKTNPGSWIKSEDYPRGNMLRGEQAIVRFRLMVDDTGRPTDCAIQSAVAKKEFSDLTGSLLLRRADFEPARTVSGVASASYYAGKVIWVMGSRNGQ